MEWVAHYGVVQGYWNNGKETMMKVSQMVEKPSYHYAEDYLGVRNSRNEKKYYATFGQYVLTPEVFEVNIPVRRSRLSGPS